MSTVKEPPHETARPEPAPPAPPPPAPHPWRGRVVFALIALVALVAAAVWGWPMVARSLNTVSTDDAYISGHVTFVAPRVGGQVTRVLVDDNVRVKKGDLLLEIDPEPYRVQAALKQAALVGAEADRRSADAQVRGTLAQARGLRWKLQTAMESVDNKVAALNAQVATLKSKEATRDRARSDYTRAEQLAKTGSSSGQEFDQAKETNKVADALARQALEEVFEARVALGLTPRPAKGELTDVPPDINQTFSSVRQALADLVQASAQVGLPLSSSKGTPKEFLDDFLKLDASGDVDKILERLIPNAPAVKQADAKVLQARHDLDQANLNLRYCRVLAEIDGVVTRRNVNPGNNLAAGQQVMAVQSLTEVWADCNFKETQLADLAIGQRVELTADIYGSKTVFKGRITGFTYGTGSTLALLPAQNATGNYVKVVQRLPVRVEFEGYDPEQKPLFAGLSVVPTVYVKEPPAGANAGKKLQDLAPRPGASP